MIISTVDIGSITSRAGAAGLKHQLETIPGVVSVDIGFSTGCATILHDGNPATNHAVRQRVRECAQIGEPPISLKASVDPSKYEAPARIDLEYALAPPKVRRHSKLAWVAAVALLSVSAAAFAPTPLADYGQASIFGLNARIWMLIAVLLAAISWPAWPLYGLAKRWLSERVQLLKPSNGDQQKT